MAPKITWTKTSNRQGEFGATYESSNGWTIEVVLEERYETGSSWRRLYSVSHYEVVDPAGNETQTDTLAAAKRLASTG